MWTWFAKLIGADVSGVQATDAATEARRQELNQRDLSSGLLDAPTWSTYQSNTAKMNEQLGYESAVQKEFNAGFQTGVNNVTGTISGIIEAPANFVWKSIPLWVWVGAALWILWELGWLKKWVISK